MGTVETLGGAKGISAAGVVVVVVVVVVVWANAVDRASTLQPRMALIEVRVVTIFLLI